MNNFSDQVLAERMLQARERGYSFSLFYRWSAKRYFFITVYFTVVLIFLALTEFWPAFYLSLGLICGTFLRDMGWVRATQKTWSFSLKVTDWEKVQNLAHNQPLP